MLSEHGEHVQWNVELELKPEHELVSLETHVELDALELSQNQEDVELQLVNCYIMFDTNTIYFKC